MLHYKVKPDSSYGKALNKSRSDQAKLVAVTNDIRNEFDLPHTSMVSMNAYMFYHPPGEIPDELKKQFKQDGFAKKNSAIFKRFIELVNAAGLTNMESESIINFGFGIMRSSKAQTLRRMTIDGADYIETNCEFSPNELSQLDEITEVKFYEVRVAALKQTNAL